MLRDELTPSQIRWFWRSLDRLNEDGTAFTEGCWNWRFGRAGETAHLGAGYGVLDLNGKRWRAHRVAYELSKGPIPDGLWVLHHCDNSRCCNPAHLYAGTAKQNTADALARGRHPGKLTQVQAEEVRRRRRDGLTLREIAELYGVTFQAIQQICSGKTHKISGLAG